LFFTGCRPSEALALRWENIQSGCIFFSEAYVQGKGGLVLKEGLKTQGSRRFPINVEVLEILDEIRKVSSDTSSSALVFPSPEGKFIDFHNFRNRAWKNVMATLEDIEYRQPYQMRHTFITLAIDAGFSIPKLAKLVGNSAKVILEHYAGTGNELTVPSLK
jgi:integrase